MTPRAFLLAGLGYGDEAKGATVDFLCHRFNAGLIVRYNGGSQAGHNVILPDGRHHCFSQFGSGMFYPDVKTHLSRFMLVNPMNMMNEEAHLRELGVTDAFARTTVDEEALIITPFHRELNRYLSPGGKNSCGQGIGACREMHFSYGDKVLFAGDLCDEVRTKTKLKFVADLAVELIGDGDITKFNEVTKWPILFGDDPIDIFWNRYKNWPVEIVPSSYLRSLLIKSNVAIFEGAQGVLLDETHGEPGFNTWTDTTFNNALTLLDEACTMHEPRRIGVLRTYATRHGAGPFPTEDATLCYPEPHNDDTGFQGKFRKGRFDMDAVRRALTICGGVDVLALNHCDVNLKPTHLPELKSELKNIGIFGFGPTREDRSMLQGTL